MLRGRYSPFNLVAFNKRLDHGLLLGLGDDDHTQYIKDSEFTQNSGFLVGTGAGTFQEETGDTARISLGVGTTDSPAFTGLTITGNSVFGLNSSVFQPATDSTTFFQVLDAGGGTPVFNVDTTNERVGIGTDAPEVEFHVVGGTSVKAKALITSARSTGSTINIMDMFAPNMTGGQGLLFSLGKASTTNRRAIWSFNRVSGTDTENYQTLGFHGSGQSFNIHVNGNIGIGIGETAPETLTEWTSATPYLTLHNSTHEDTDGGRESRLNFKGEQGVDPFEETTLARIEVSHDGSGADDKGKIVISTNDGSDGDTPTDHFKIDAAGNTYIGDGGTTDYSQFEADGTLIFNGAATVFNDLVLPLDSARVPASNAPNWESFVGNLNAFAYQVNDFQEFTTEMIHGYKEGSDFSFHIHGALNALTAQEEKVRFEIEYSIADVNQSTGFGDVFPDGSGSLLIAELVVPNATADLTHIFIVVGVDSAGTFGIDATIKGRIRRIAKTAGGNELTGDIFVTQVGVHYENDTVGSRVIGTK